MPENTIHTLRDELDRRGDREIRVDEVEVYTTDMKRKVHRRPTGSPYEPRRNTEQPGWYKEMAAEMGITSKTSTPVMKRANLLHSSMSNDYKYRSDSRISRAYSSASDADRSTPRDRSVSPRRSEKSVRIGSVTDLESGLTRDQEFYAHRDSRQGKPLPGDNGYMYCSWPYGLADNSYQRREPGSPPRHAKPPIMWGSRTSLDDRSRSPSPIRRAASVPPHECPKKIPLKETVSMPSTPLPDYLANLKHIKVATVPVPVPPKFGTLNYGGRWADYAAAPVEGGPPCQLCSKPITEKRCIVHQDFKYHCWHYVCSFCSKTLKEDDFTMAIDQKPYCINCHKRMYP